MDIAALALGYCDEAVIISTDVFDEVVIDNHTIGIVRLRVRKDCREDIGVFEGCSHDSKCLSEESPADCIVNV